MRRSRNPNACHYLRQQGAFSHKPLQLLMMCPGIPTPLSTVMPSHLANTTKREAPSSQSLVALRLVIHCKKSLTLVVLFAS